MDQGAGFGLTRKTVCAIIPVLLIASTFVFALNVQRAMSGSETAVSKESISVLGSVAFPNGTKTDEEITRGDDEECN